MRSLVFVLAAAGVFAQEPPFDEVLRLVRSGSAEAEGAVRRSVPAADLKAGRAVLFRGGEFVFAIESARRPQLVIDEEAPVAMRRIGETGLWVYAGTVQTARTHNFHYIVASERFGGRTDVPAFGPYSYERAGVPRGILSEKMVHTSRIYPGMRSDWWIYVPAQYEPSKPAAVMIWQDGEVLVNREMPSRAQVVFDNLTHEGKIPVIIHVLISPGLTAGKRMRSIEYDTVDDTYARFIREEILPEVAKRYRIRTDGYSRAVAGASSGGICAFNMAWQMPGEFSRILSQIGSFTSLQWKPGERDGGNVYPFKIRKEPKRNIRVWLQDGSGDLENEHGSWPLQNIAMANSLKMMGYDFRFSWGNGTHSRNGGHAELAEEMIWLWRDYDPAKTGDEYRQDALERARPVFRVGALNRQ